MNSAARGEVPSFPFESSPYAVGGHSSDLIFWSWRNAVDSVVTRENVMPTFMCFLNWTDQGTKNIKDVGKRSSAASELAKKLGGKLVSTYITTGHYDVVATVDMPSGDEMAKFAAALSASGNARTTTVRAFAPEEFARLVGSAPSMGG
jgi:uncharacterized protein with GYD domain